MRSPLLLAAASFALTGTIMLAAVPADARGASTDYRCTALLEQSRAAVAAATDPAVAQRAARAIRTGETLCEARAEGAAANQFRRALTMLGVEEVRTTTTPAEIAAR